MNTIYAAAALQGFLADDETLFWDVLDEAVKFASKMVESEDEYVAKREADE